MQEISTSSAVILLIVLVFFLFAYMRGKKKYQTYIEALDKKEFPLREFFFLGFTVMELIHYTYSTALDRKNRKYIKELHNPDYAEFYLRVYWAQAMTYTCLALFIGALMNMALGDPVVGAFLAFGLGAFLPFMALRDLENEAQKIHMADAIVLPELVNKIVILTGAGLTLQGALAKISEEMHSEKHLYQVLDHVMAMIDSGESADAAFDYMCTRCNTPETRRFVSIIVQNIHRGGSDVSVALKGIGDELWANRKATALRLAEEATTKLLFPMMLMLGAVIVLVVVPAVSSLQL